MKKKIIIIGILLLLFVYNCVYYRMTHLSKDDLSWINSTENFSSIYFISNTGDLDTLTPIGKFVHNSTDRFYCSAAHGGTYIASAGYKYEMRHSDTINDFYFAVKRVVDNDSLQTRSVCFEFGSDLMTVRPQTFRLEDKDYSDCVIFDSGNSSYNEYWTKKIKNKVVKFVVSKKYGLIYYEFENGESYMRKFHK